MPLYEYQCESCTHRFELIQKFSDPPVQTCPACGGRVAKLLSSPAIQFKGSGWYITDYARKGSSGQKDSDQKKEDKDRSASPETKDAKSSPAADSAPSSPASSGSGASSKES